MHFLRNVLDYLPRKAGDECMTELRWIYDRWTIEEALMFYRLPRPLRTNLKIDEPAESG
jgi:transposase-like protein